MVKNKIDLQTRRKEFNDYLFNLMEAKFLLLLSTVTEDFPIFVEMFQFLLKFIFNICLSKCLVE